MFGFSPKFLAERPSLEQIICNGVERGVDPDMPGDDEQKAKGPYKSEHQLAGGLAPMLRRADLIKPLTRIGNAGKHLLGLTNDILDLSKLGPENSSCNAS
jgi:hypothetical protein